MRMWKEGAQQGMEVLVQGTVGPFQAQASQITLKVEGTIKVEYNEDIDIIFGTSRLEA